MLVLPRLLRSRMQIALLYRADIRSCALEEGMRELWGARRKFIEKSLQLLYHRHLRLRCFLGSAMRTACLHCMMTFITPNYNICAPYHLSNTFIQRIKVVQARPLWGSSYPRYRARCICTNRAARSRWRSMIRRVRILARLLRKRSAATWSLAC